MMFGNGIGNCLGVGVRFIHGGGGIFIMLILVVLIILSVILIVKKTHHHQAENAILEALKMRLVKGEITEEEYMRKKTILK